MVQVIPEDEIPITFDTIKHKNPLYPTYSRGKVGKALYNNNKYQCYGVAHFKPVYDVMPYRATGFGFGERSLNYIPLTHVHDRSKTIVPRDIYEKTEIKKIYDSAIDVIKDSIAKRDGINSKPKKQLRIVEKDYSNTRNGATGDARYRAHSINRVLYDAQEIMQSK